VAIGVAIGLGVIGASAAFCRQRRVALTTGVAAGVVGLSGCAWLETKHRRLLYRPTPGRPDGFAGLREGDEAYSRTIVADQPTQSLDGTDHPAGTIQEVRLWWLPHPQADAPALLYLHGTFRNLYQNLGKIDALREAGFAVLAVEYRGWGSSSAIVPSEQTINADAALGWAELVRRVPDPARRVVYGHSLGGGVAVELASRLRRGADYAALIVESTFTRVSDVARIAGRLAGWLGTLTTQRFASIDRIAQVDAPVLVLHGTDDDTVAIELGRALYDAARPPKQFVAIEGGSHSRLQSDAPQRYQAALREFVASWR
jgi:hypothetical protein